MASCRSADESMSAFQLFIPLLTCFSLLETERLFRIVQLSRRARTAKIYHLHIYSLWYTRIQQQQITEAKARRDAREGGSTGTVLLA